MKGFCLKGLAFFFLSSISFAMTDNQGSNQPSVSDRCEAFLRVAGKQLDRSYHRPPLHRVFNIHKGTHVLNQKNFQITGITFVNGQQIAIIDVYYDVGQGEPHFGAYPLPFYPTEHLRNLNGRDAGPDHYFSTHDVDGGLVLAVREKATHEVIFVGVPDGTELMSITALQFAAQLLRNDGIPGYAAGAD